MEPIQENKQSLEQMPPEFHGEEMPRLTFKESIGECLSKYATFTGRSRRSEYWWFGLLALVLTNVSYVCTHVVNTFFTSETAMGLGIFFQILLLPISLFAVIPSFAVQTRRLHDVGRSGWWIVCGFAVGIFYLIAKSVVLGFNALDSDNEVQNLIDAFHVSTVGGTVMLLLALVGLGLSIALLVFSLQDSHRGENKYGPSPKYP